MKVSSPVLGFLPICIYVLLLCSQIKAELFTALVDLERILYAEDNIAKDLRAYISSEEARLNKLKQ